MNTNRYSLRLPAAHFFGLLIAALCLNFASVGEARADTCRVSTAGTAANDGSTWALPMDLQTALGDANCSEIWVKAGVYHPGPDIGDTFAITRELALYGGFAGTEAGRGERDPALHATVLSGVIPDAIPPALGNNYNVVYIAATAGATITSNTVIDGFTITGASAGALFCLANGAGSRCSPLISHVTFSANGGVSGGAMAIFGSSGGTSSPTLENVTFSGNSAATGGALFVRTTDGGISQPVLYNVTFNGNSAFNGSGGALYVDNAGPYLFNVTITDNSASQSGGGIIFTNPGAGELTLNNVILWGNTAASDPQIANSGSSTQLTISHSVVQGAFPGGVWDSDLGVNAGNNTQANPYLGSLALHGGSTRTRVPGTGSSAIDAGNDQCLSDTLLGVDQRGVPRPQGEFCDIGAVEVAYATDLTIGSVSGSGSISASADGLLVDGGIVSCDGSVAVNCHAAYPQRTVVQLNATPAAYWSFLGWSGDCTGSNIHITVYMDAAKTCDATFVPNADANLMVTIDDARDYARVGQLLSYGIAVSNTGGTAVAEIAVSDVLPTQLDSTSAHWQCLPTGGAICTTTGEGDLVDSIGLPAHSSVFYMLDAYAQGGANDNIVNQVGVTSSSGTMTASDTTTLVIFRDGFEDGGSGVQAQVSPPSVVSLAGLSTDKSLLLPLEASALPARRIASIAATDDGALRVQAIRVGKNVWLRLLVRSQETERASSWSVLRDPPLVIGFHVDTHGNKRVVLSGVEFPIEALMPPLEH